ncbi:MAG: peptidoglycan editing factor PgeF [Butyrivibrio sp.]|nr:peptidoglycan editing factor PgeF [Acetatifactor muris]MCM1558533.1 peptidoglycan editing factor PgeF [Butyrivibrio sp.]
MYTIRRAERAEGPVLKQNRRDMGDGGEMEFLTFPSLEKTGLVKHLFTTRLGGVSRGEFSSMNLSFTRGDRSDCVAENYRRIGEALGCTPEDMVASRQTHTTNIRKVGLKDKGKGITRPGDYEDIDGLMTDVSGIVLVTFFADCVPLFFVDTAHRAIGLAHSGWRGTAAGMGSCMIRAMGEAYGTRPEDLRVAIGPSICAGCYEVGQEVAVQFERFPGVVTQGREPGKYHLDLWEANRQLLVAAGVQDREIAVTDICTCCNGSYLFSHRASGGRRGNMGAFLCLR